MKAFLLSDEIHKSQYKDFLSLLQKPIATKALFVTAAATPYGKELPQWALDSMEAMQPLCTNFDVTNLEDEKIILNDLLDYDFIFFTGGNTFYLAYVLKQTGFDKKIKSYIEKGGLYSGASAGAIILMKDIDYIKMADSPEDAPEISEPLGVVDYAVLPHADHERYGPLIAEIQNLYNKNNVETITLDDGQALVINDQERKII